MPDVALCPLCHPPSRLWLRFSLPSGRFLCPHLAQSQPGEATLSLHRDVQSLFLTVSRITRPSPVDQLFADFASKKNHVRSNLILGLSRFLGMFITFHLDVPSAVRRVTCEMLDTTPTQKPALLENS
jgi:hypothetical protein